MEAMVYVDKEDSAPEFRTLLWRLMQDFGERPMNRKEMAARLTKAGFPASDNNVSQWLNGDRTPPPGLPYYSTIALGLDEEGGQSLAWAYSRSYRDNRRGANLSGVNKTASEDLQAGAEAYKDMKRRQHTEEPVEGEPGDRRL